VVGLGRVQRVHDGDLSRALQRLEAHRPTTPQPSTLDHQPSTDLRGWEWRYLWKQSQDERLYILGHHSNGVSSVGILPDGKTAFSAGYDKAVRLWNLESRREIGLLPHDDGVTGAACSPDGRWLATGTYSKLNRCPLRLWDLATRQSIPVLTTNFWLRDTIVFSPDSKLLAFVDMDAGLHLWNLRRVRRLRIYPPSSLHGSAWRGVFTGREDVGLWRK
jgi:WD40 repeat protein